MAANVAQGLQLGTDLTGVNLHALLARLSGDARPADGKVGDGKAGAIERATAE